MFVRGSRSGELRSEGRLLLMQTDMADSWSQLASRLRGVCRAFCVFLLSLSSTKATSIFSPCSSLRKSHISKLKLFPSINCSGTNSRFQNKHQSRTECNCAWSRWENHPKGGDVKTCEPVEKQDRGRWKEQCVCRGLGVKENFTFGKFLNVWFSYLNPLHIFFIFLKILFSS